MVRAREDWKGPEYMSCSPVPRLRQLISPVLGIFVLAVLVGVVYNLTVARGYFPQRDSFAYQTIAFNILDHHCFCSGQGVTVSRAPLWPLLISGISLVVGRANLFDRLFLCLLNAGTCVLVYALVRDLFGRRLGLLAGFFAAIYPALYIYTGWLYTETLYTFLQTAVVYILLRIQRGGDRDWRLWGLCGVLLGMLALTHPNGVLVTGLMALWAVVLVWRRLLPRPTLGGTALAVGLACALIVPWTIRNAAVSHAFVPVATGSGTVLYGAYNTTTVTKQAWLGAWYNLGISGLGNQPPIQLDTCSAPCEVLLDGEESAAAIHWVKTHVSELPLLVYYHLHNFLIPYTDEADMPIDRFPWLRSSRLVHAMSNTFPVPVLLLAVLGLVVTLRRRWRELFFVYLVIGGTVAQILVLYGNARFRTPIEPLLLLLGSGAIWWLTDPGPGTLHHWRSLMAKQSSQAVPVTETGCPSAGRPS